MFKITDYFLTPLDIPRLIKDIYQRIKFTDVLIFIVLSVSALLLKYFFHFTTENLFFICFIIAMIYWDLDSRVSIGLALACLIIIPILLILFNKNLLFTGEEWAEKVAVWAYYFLVIGVVKQIFEYRKDEKNKAMQ